MVLRLLFILVVIKLAVANHFIVVGDTVNWEEDSTGNKLAECIDDDATTGWGTNDLYGNDIGAQCCSMDGTSGYRQNLPGGTDINSHTGCLIGVTYSVAKAACDVTGGRLCTAQEVRDLTGAGSGCNHDARHVWTSDECAAHKIVVGANSNIADRPEECADDDAVTGIGYNSYQNEIGAQCCSMDGSTGSRQNLPGGIDTNSHTGCLTGVTYIEAKASCETAGQRLCTAQEVASDVGEGSGCNHDYRHVWTSELCDNTAHTIVVGAQGNVDEKPEECAVNTITEGVASNEQGDEIGVQCCSMDGTTGVRQNLPGGEDIGSYKDCLNGVTYDTAKRACRDIGRRLCTVQEVENHIGRGSGCNHDSRHVWTQNICETTAHAIVVGSQVYVGDKPEECTLNTVTNGVSSNSFGDEIGVQCCSLDGSEGTRTGCVQGVTYFEAKTACQAEGKRLCTAPEVAGNVGKGSGCNHDARHVWTSDSCDNTAHLIVVGNRANWETHSSGDKPEECADSDGRTGIASNEHGNDIGVQCCLSDGSDGYRQNLPGGIDYDGYTGCLLGVPYSVGKAACKDTGGRLCTAQEVRDHIGAGSGCNHDARHVWTSNQCEMGEEQGIDCCAKRCRREWSTLSQTERDLYIDGFKALADSGDVQLMSKSHSDLFSNRIHGTELFLPWHRAYLYDLESAIRALGPEYECFGLPYWDWSNEPTPTDVSNGETLVIMNSGLGNDPQGSCINDGSPFSDGQYDPQSGSCLIRNVRYTSGRSSCVFSTPSSLMDIIDSTTVYTSFRPSLEGTPHARPHICISGQMSRGNSPDDPIFYLHHNFVDYIWALWQDCNDYDGVITTEDSDEYSGPPDEVLQLPHNTNANWVAADVIDISDLDVIYEKGPFWDNANVDDADNCGVNSNPDNINNEWFYEDTSRRRRLSESKDHSQQIYDDLVKRGGYENHKKLVHEWSVLVCEWEQQRSGKICKPPNYYDDCSNMEINPYTNDIDISLDELLAKQGINECQKETRRETYDWAVLNRELYELCAGCFDPFCDDTFLREKCRKSPKRKKKKKKQNVASFPYKSPNESPIYKKNNPISNKPNDNKYIYINISKPVLMIICGLIIILLILNFIVCYNKIGNNNKPKYNKIKYIDSDSEFVASDSNLVI